MANIRIKCKDHSLEFPIDETKYLKDLLLENGIAIASPCGGQGKCGKCRVRVRALADAEPAGNEASPAFFSEVLACNTIISRPCEIEIPEEALLTFKKQDDPEKKNYGSPETVSRDASPICAGVDLGTTTIAVQLLDQKSGVVLAKASQWNEQVSCGADVISRIKYCSDVSNGLTLQSRMVQRQTRSVIEDLCKQTGRDYSCLVKIVIAGNTIMQHIFAGFDPSTIAVAPFRPQTLFEEDREYHFDLLGGAAVHFMPCIAGYVGGDITSGLYATDLYNKEGTYLFLDIGTNGEMAIGGRDGFTTCSVACGPAFEGAEITCGMTGRGGAINHLLFDEKNCKMKMSVIGECQPKGICGSGLIDLLAILTKAGLIDENGRLLPPKEAKSQVSRLTMARLKNCLGYNFLRQDQDGNGQIWLKAGPAAGPAGTGVCEIQPVYLTATDVRKIQLAKAAIAAGIRILMQETGRHFDEIDGLIIAGGFGENIDPVNAAAIGMIPEELSGKIISAGNSSLAGVRKWLTDKDGSLILPRIIKKCRYIELSGRKDFTEAFVDHMSF